jgi:general secretion pathway protein H
MKLIKQQKGFTLIEVLMVVFIMGMVMSVISLALPPSSDFEGHPHEQAERLRFIMEEISDRATMEGRVIGLRLEEDSYKFVIQSRSNSKVVDGSKSLEQEILITDWELLSWVEYSRDDIATSKNFSEEVFVTLEIGGLSIQTKEEGFDDFDFDKDKTKAGEKQPQILFYPTGEVTPFRLRFNIKGQDTKDDPIMIIASELGKFRLFDPEIDKL